MTEAHIGIKMYVQYSMLKKVRIYLYLITTKADLRMKHAS